MMVYIPEWGLVLQAKRLSYCMHLTHLAFSPCTYSPCTYSPCTYAQALALAPPV